MIDIELIVDEIDKKIALLESIEYFNKKEMKSNIICVSVNEFTDFYKLENQTSKIPPNHRRKFSQFAKSQEPKSEVIEINFNDQDDEVETIEMKYSQQNMNKIPLMMQNEILDVENKSEKSDSIDSESFGKRKRVKNSRYNEEEYLLKNTSRQFTNAIRGKVGKHQKDSVVEQLDMSSRDLSKSEILAKKIIEAKIDNSQVNLKKEENLQLIAKSIEKPKIVPLEPEESSKTVYKFAPNQHNRRKQTFQTTLKSRKFFCKLCNKTFSKGYSLTRHMYLHSGLRPHVCFICDFKFIQRSDLERHLTVHQEDPQFACNHCDSKFRTKKSLRNHAILHDNATPFHCPCGKKFRSNKTLRIHHLTRHSKVTYECDFDGKLYTLKDYLKSHLKTHAIGGNNFIPKNEEEKRIHGEEKIKRLRSLIRKQSK